MKCLCGYVCERAHKFVAHAVRVTYVRGGLYLRSRQLVSVSYRRNTSSVVGGAEILHSLHEYRPMFMYNVYKNTIVSPITASIFPKHQARTR